MIIGISGKAGSGKDTIATMINIAIYQIENPSDEVSFEEHLNENWNNPFVLMRFADRLKDFVAMILGHKVDIFEDREFKEKELDAEIWTRYYYSCYKFKNYSNPKGKISNYYSSKEEAKNDHVILRMFQNEDIKLESEVLTPRILMREIGTEVGRAIHPNIWINAVLTRIERFKGKGNIIIPDMRFPNEFQTIKNLGGITIRVNKYDIVNQSRHPSETSLDDVEHDYFIDNFGSLDKLYRTVYKFTEEKIYPNLIKN